MRVMRLVVICIVFPGFLVSCVTPGGVSALELPGFYLNPPSSPFKLYGVGEAKMATDAMSRTVAITRARDDIARQVGVSVKNAITDYAVEAGEADNTKTVGFAEVVSQQTANVSLSMVKTEKIAFASNGTFYALVSYPVRNIVKDAEMVMDTNKQEAFPEFSLDRAMSTLKNELRINPPRPSSVK